MKILLRTGFLFLLVFYISNTGFSQVTGSNTTQEATIRFDQKLLKYYSKEELQDLYTNSLEKYNVISYYYLSSYLLVVTDSSNPYLSVFDIDNFDISKYEIRRELSEEVELNFDKYGVKLIILPYDQLQYLTPMQAKRVEDLQN